MFICLRNALQSHDHVFDSQPEATELNFSNDPSSVLKFGILRLKNLLSPKTDLFLRQKDLVAYTTRVNLQTLFINVSSAGLITF